MANPNGSNDINMDHTKDCWPCRIISGTGVIGAGLYVYHQGKRQSPYPRMVMTAISCGICGIGLCRLLGLPPFESKHKRQIESSSL